MNASCSPASAFFRRRLKVRLVRKRAPPTARLSNVHSAVRTPGVKYHIRPTVTAHSTTVCTCVLFQPCMNRLNCREATHWAWLSSSDALGLLMDALPESRGG